jgi:hypothetical protein
MRMFGLFVGLWLVVGCSSPMVSPDGGAAGGTGDGGAASTCSGTLSGAATGTFACEVLTPRYNASTGLSNVLLSFTMPATSRTFIGASVRTVGKLELKTYGAAAGTDELVFDAQINTKDYHAQYSGPGTLEGHGSFTFTDITGTDSFGDLAYTPHGTAEAGLVDTASTSDPKPEVATLRITF